MRKGDQLVQDGVTGKMKMLCGEFFEEVLMTCSICSTDDWAPAKFYRVKKGCPKCHTADAMTISDKATGRFRHLADGRRRRRLAVEPLLHQIKRLNGMTPRM